MTHRTLIMMLLAAPFALGWSACHSDGMYADCPLSNSILDACAQAVGEGKPCMTTADDCQQDGLLCLDSSGVERLGANPCDEGGCACTDGTFFTCVVEEHPFCLEEICASWKGGPSVCTRACTCDADCPGEATCVRHQGYEGPVQFCVQGARVDVTSEPEPICGEQIEQPAAVGCSDATECGDGLECCPDGQCAAAGTCG